MSLSPSSKEKSPECEMTEICVKLDDQFLSMQEPNKLESMSVFARIRPMLPQELTSGYKECIVAADDQTVRAIVPISSSKYRSNSRFNQNVIQEFTFTSVLGPEVGQFLFFEDTMMNTMQNFIEGQNSLVFSYGITGSGKTYTLHGNSENPGLIPLSMHLFFASIENQLIEDIIVKPDKFADILVLNDMERKKELQIKEQLLSLLDQEEGNLSSNSSNSIRKSFAMLLCDSFSDKFSFEERETTLPPDDMVAAQAAMQMKELSKRCAEQQAGLCSIWISFVEIYNENIYDLLQPTVNQRSKLQLGEDKNGDVYIKGVREVCVSNCHEALKLLYIGKRNLRIASTKLNYQSSRSHCIFTVKVVRITNVDNASHGRVNRLSFCDLAGSERAAKSQTSGLHLKEAGCINTSLLVLGRCLDQLRMNATLRDKKMIPFRDSKLTRLFSGYFMGKGKAVMIANASPSEYTFDETLHVLRFSALAKELVINDAYITTTSTALQNITNQWANMRANTSQSICGDQTISFDDSTDNIIQEKDELIEKLLDLAESLRKNLEAEKKEKAELEIQIRQDVCQEYASYSDQLIERQRKLHEEELETTKEIYEKRISAMETMYEDIIKGYKLQLEETSDSEDEQAFDLANNTIEFKGIQDDAGVGKPFIKQEENSEFVDSSRNGDLHLLKETNGNVEQDCTIIKLQEENRKLLNELLTLSDELAAAQREVTLETVKAQGAQNEISDLKQSIENLNNVINNLKEKIPSIEEQNTSLEQIDEEATELKDKLITTNMDLQEANETIEKLKRERNSLQDDYISQQNEYAEVVELKKHLEEDFTAVSNQYAGVTEENSALAEKVLESEKSISELKGVISNLEQEIGMLNNQNIENFEEYEKSLKILEESKLFVAEENSALAEKVLVSEKSISELKGVISNLEQEIGMLNNQKIENFEEYEKSLKILEESAVKTKNELDVTATELKEAMKTVEELKTELASFQSECISSNKEILELTNAKMSLKEEFHFVFNQLAAADAEKSVLIEKMHDSDKVISNLNETIDSLNKDIEELNNEKMKLTAEKENAVRLSEEKTAAAKSALSDATKELNETLQTVENQKKEICSLYNDGTSLTNEVTELNEAKQILEKNLHSISNKLDAANKENDALCKKIREKDEYESDLKMIIEKLNEDNVESNKQILESKEGCRISQKDFEKRASEADDLVACVRQELIVATDKLTELERELASLRALKSSYETEVTGLQEAKRNLEEDRTSIVNELDAAKEENDALCKKMQNKDECISDLNKVIEQLKEDIEELNKQKLECKEYENSLKDLEKRASKAEDLVSSLKVERKEALDKLAELETELASLSALKMSHEKEVADLQEAKRNLGENYTSIVKELAASDTEKSRLEEKIHNAEEHITSLDEAINVLKKDVAQLRNEKLESNAKYEDSVKLFEEKLSKANGDLDAGKEDLKEAMQIVDTQKAELSALHAECQAYKQEIEELKVERPKFTSSSDQHVESAAQSEHSSNVLPDLESAGDLENADCLNNELLTSKEENEKLIDMERNLIYKLVEILEECELKASKKTKELHSVSIKHVEHIMDLNKQLAEKECYVEDFKKALNDKQKELKDFQSASKKQILIEKQQHTTELQEAMQQKKSVEQEIFNLKQSIKELQAEKEKQVSSSEKEKHSEQLSKSENEERKCKRVKFNENNEDKHESERKTRRALRQKQEKSQELPSGKVKSNSDETSEPVKRKLNTKEEEENDDKMHAKKRSRSKTLKETEVENIAPPQKFSALTKFIAQNPTTNILSPRMTRNRRKMFASKQSSGLCEKNVSAVGFRQSFR